MDWCFPAGTGATLIETSHTLLGITLVPVSGPIAGIPILIVIVPVVVVTIIIIPTPLPRISHATPHAVNFDPIPVLVAGVVSTVMTHIGQVAIMAAIFQMDGWRLSLLPTTGLRKEQLHRDFIAVIGTNYRLEKNK